MSVLSFQVESWLWCHVLALAMGGAFFPSVAPAAAAPSSRSDRVTAFTQPDPKVFPKRFGLRAIDAIVITHMHDDHFLEAPHLRQKWGAPIWALDRMAAVCEHPERFDYAAPIQAYGKKGKITHVLRQVKLEIEACYRPPFLGFSATRLNSIHSRVLV